MSDVGLREVLPILEILEPGLPESLARREGLKKRRRTVVRESETSEEKRRD